MFIEQGGRSSRKITWDRLDQILPYSFASVHHCNLPPFVVIRFSAARYISQASYRTSTSPSTLHQQLSRTRKYLQSPKCRPSWPCEWPLEGAERVLIPPTREAPEEHLLPLISTFCVTCPDSGGLSAHLRAAAVDERHTQPSFATI
ncbi:hypothetical protein LIA77_05821 [Sarocladium implicatum]|nr:hypothetical protein LIA77_05821 [Sarocladium implicatum]